MKNVLYVGNALSNKGKTVTTIETLGDHLNEISTIKIASNKSNKTLRLLDMVKLVLLNRKSTDLVLIDTYSTTNFYYALIISQLCRILKNKYIPILHGGNLEKRLKSNPKLSKLIFENAHRLVAPSNFLKTVFRSYGYNNVVHIPNTIEIDAYQFKSRPIDTLKLLWVRSFASIYNPQLALNVLESLLNKGLKAQLTMVGPDVDGSLEKVKNLSKRKKLDVNFTGKLSKQQWIALSNDHNIFINTTNFDNTPVSVIEAMALGLPVVSTNVGGLPFLISHNEEALLVPPNNIEAMSKAIVKLKKDKNLKSKLITNARYKAEQFDWDVVKSRWIDLLS